MGQKTTRLLLTAGFILLSAFPAQARERFFGYCRVLADASPTQCLITVFDQGTTDLSTIYSDNSGTIESNPFTAESSGFFRFYADDARYDVRQSGGSIVTPFTWADVLLDDTEQNVQTIVAIASGATPAFDVGNASIITFILTENVTSSTITNGVTGQVIRLYLAQDGTGGWTFVWPADVQLRGGGYVVSDDASAVSVIALYYDGTNWREIARDADEVGRDWIPTSTGSNLGSTGARWDAFIQALDISGNVTGNLSPAATGQNLGTSSALWDAYIRGNLIGSVRIVGGDFATIQAAIDDLTTGQVFLPCGTYNSATSITLKNGVDIVGAGWGCVTVNLTVTNDTLFEYLAASEQEGARVSIRNLSITADTTTGTVGIGLRLLKNVVIENVSFQTLATGISLDRGRDYKLHNIRMRSVTNGILATDTSDASHIFDIQLSNILIENITGTGIELRRAINTLSSNINITDDGADANSIGIHLRNDTQGSMFSSGVVAGLGRALLIETQTGTPLSSHFVGFTFDNSQTNPLVSITGADVASFNGCTFTGADQDAISISDGDFINVTGSVLFDNDRHDIALTTTAASNIQIVGNNFQGLGKDAVTTYDQINVAAGVIRFLISSNRFSHALGSGNAARYAVNVVAGSSNEYSIVNNTMLGQGTGSIFDGGTGTAKQIFGNLQLAGTVATAYVSEGLGTNGTGFKHTRVTTGSIALSSSAAVVVTWTTAFADANYTADCEVVQSDTSVDTLKVDHIESVVAASVTVRVENTHSGAARTGTLHCMAVHD